MAQQEVLLDAGYGLVQLGGQQLRSQEVSGVWGVSLQKIYVQRDVPVDLLQDQLRVLQLRK